MNVFIYILLCVLLSFVNAKPNIVVILTDDQDVLLDSMIALPNVKELIGDMGVTFESAFVNTPVCCPSRSTLLTGKYLHNTQVVNNSLSGNCSSRNWQINHELFSFSSLLKREAQYTTFYAGKYLNEYGNAHCGGTKHVPFGYDWWIGLKGNSRYYNYTLSLNGTAQTLSNEYLTDVIKNYALDFLNQKHIENTPFLMTLATPAPHAPFTPAPRHKHSFPNVKAVKNPSFNYSDNMKHWLIRMPPAALPPNAEILDEIQKQRFQTLLSVDEMVRDIIFKLQSINILNNTYIIFTSDNGYHIGQFTQAWDKRQPYETDIKIPFLIRGPNLKTNFTSNFPVSFVDVAPTILDIAGINLNHDMDGRSFLPEIRESDMPESGEEKIILIEYFGEGNQKKIDERCPWKYDENLTECTLESWCKCQDSRNNSYTCIRRLSNDINLKYCEFRDDENFIEMYNLNEDPFELKNIRDNVGFEVIQDNKKILEKLKACKGNECQYSSLL